MFSDSLEEKESFYSKTEEITAIQEEVGLVGRTIVLQSSDRMPLFPLNSLSCFDIPCVVGYDSILPNGMQRGIPKASDDLPSAYALGRKGVTHLVTFKSEDRPVDGWDFVRSAGDVSIYKNMHARA